MFKKIYDKISILPITLLIFAGAYEMLLGDLLREVLSGTISWTIPVTENMLIDTVLTLILVHFLLNGFPRFYKKIRDNSRTKWIAKIFSVSFFGAAVLLFVLGQFFLKKTLFYLNYLLFMLVLLIFCIIQKIIESKLYKKESSESLGS